MLLNIFFENYRSFRDPVHLSMVAEASKSKESNVFVQKIKRMVQEDEERLLKSVVIYGANASGKSNLIRGVRDILSFACRFLSAAGDPIFEYSPFAFDSETRNAPVKFAIEFISIDNIRYKYELSFSKSIVISESLSWWPNGKPAILFERLPAEHDEILTHQAKINLHQRSDELEVFRNQTILSKFGNQEADTTISAIYLYLNNIDIVTPLDVSGSRRDRDQVSKKLLNNNKLLKRLNELLRFADTGLKSISIEKIPSTTETRTIRDEMVNFRRGPSFSIESFHEFFENGKLTNIDVIFPFAEESNGVKMLYTFGGRILSILEEGGVIFVDELETSLHPYLSKLLVLLFQNTRINPKNAQLIFTTHDTNLLERNIFRKDQIWFAQKDAFGKTELYSLQDFQDVREDTPFDKWYLAGKFGGIPDLKSLESLFEDI